MEKKNIRETLLIKDKIEKVLEYMESNNYRPNLFISTLPKYSKSKDELNRFMTTSILLNSVDNSRKDNYLRRLYNLCDDKCFCFIFSNDKKLLEDIEFMTRAGFYYVKMLVYKTETKKSSTKLFKDNLGIILFFTKESNITKISSLNKVSGRENTSLLDIEIPKVKTMSNKVITYLFKISLNKKLNENLVLDLFSDTGEVGRIALDFKVPCIVRLSKDSNSNIVRSLTGYILIKEQNKQKKIDNETVNKRKLPRSDEYKKKISNGAKKTILEKKIKKIVDKSKKV